MTILKKIGLCTLLISSLTPLSLKANPVLKNPDFLPASLIQLDNTFTHHVVVAEKSTHKLHLFENDKGVPKYVKSFNAATGKRKGDKLVQGDHKTPEGVYQMTEFIPKADLMAKYGKEGEIYGAGAFVLNYPNPIDRRTSKTGSGIWLHSTNDNSRINKGLDSRGCVVVVDEDLKDVSRYVELNFTNMIIVQDLTFLPKKTWNLRKKNITTMVNQWLVAWQEENFDDYISHYHPQKFRDPIRGSYLAFRAYKRAVFSNAGKPIINASDINILAHPDYVVVQFKQDYQSETIKDVGKKTLYLEKDQDYNWKIVAEAWQKFPTVPGSEKVAFRPKMRFFSE